MTPRRLLFFAAAASAAFGQLPAEQKKLNLASFEQVWTTIRDKHWEQKPGGLDWQAIHEEFRPKVEAAQSTDEARAAMSQMLARLKQTHFGIIPGGVYEALESNSGGDSAPGIDLRVLNHQAIVTGLDPGSPAERAGVKPGWQILRVKGQDLAPVIEKAQADPAGHELNLVRALLARMSGPLGTKTSVTFLDGGGKQQTLDLELVPQRGEVANFGNLPGMHVWYEARKIGKISYVRFNMFLDLVRVMASFGDTIKSCPNCDGLVIDLRGNPGGIGGMAMGMAGFLIDKPGLRLGAMYTRDTTLNFVINPRLGGFEGPVAVLIDSSSASTSEIFAGGLKDLGRARVFGTRSAAAALPSVIERLPNGDGFQYAIANYVSESGKPLEGIGVTPDTEVRLTREALLAGHDPVLDAALDWIEKRRSSK
jgi:carboxyl-terminal processing protease